MFRKWIFFGLMILLGTVLAWMIIESRRLESRAMQSPPEVVQKARPSPTRVIDPEDLEIVASRTQFFNTQPNDGTESARQSIEISNRGQSAYHDTMVAISCSAGGGKVLASSNHLVPGTIEPGQTVTADAILIRDVPDLAVRCTARILYSDLGPAPAAPSESPK